MPDLQPILRPGLAGNGQRCWHTLAQRRKRRGRRIVQASIRVTDAYRYYVAWLLCGVYTISLMDRQLVAVLVEPIRTEFALQDWHMGLLSGLAFAAFYTTLGVPLARLAD